MGPGAGSHAVVTSVNPWGPLGMYAPIQSGVKWLRDRGLDLLAAAIVWMWRLMYLVGGLVVLAAGLRAAPYLYNSAVALGHLWGRLAAGEFSNRPGLMAQIANTTMLSIFTAILAVSHLASWFSWVWEDPETSQGDH